MEVRPELVEVDWILESCEECHSSILEVVTKPPDHLIWIERRWSGTGAFREGSVVGGGTAGRDGDSTGG